MEARPPDGRLQTALPLPFRRLLLAAAAALAVVPASAHAATATAAHVPGQVIVQYRLGADAHARAAVQRAVGLGHPKVLASHMRLLTIDSSKSVATAVRELRALPEVRAAAPNAIAHAAGWIPDDPGRSHQPGGWQSLQWNFDGPYGIDAPDAWTNLVNAGHPGGRGVVVAVLDTGIAYENYRRYRRSPDFKLGDFVPGYDFVDNDHHPDDENGHGTHVAGTIGEATDNGIGVTGLAYGAKLMPVRVLDSLGSGDSVTISAGVRYAVKQGAQVINLSFEFDDKTTSRDIPDLLAALRYANRHKVTVVGAAGNSGGTMLAYPARAPGVISVGATTEHGCEAEYSNSGPDLDIVAPGGGADAALANDPKCHPFDDSGRDIYQETFNGSVRRFGLPSGYDGTSMASPHVAATAALIIASRVLGAHPSPAAIRKRLRTTAKPLGPADNYGAGLVDAAAATARTL